MRRVFEVLSVVFLAATIAVAAGASSGWRVLVMLSSDPAIGPYFFSLFHLPLLLGAALLAGIAVAIGVFGILAGGSVGSLLFSGGVHRVKRRGVAEFFAAERERRSGKVELIGRLELRRNGRMTLVSTDPIDAFPQAELREIWVIDGVFARYLVETIQCDEAGELLMSDFAWIRGNLVERDGRVVLSMVEDAAIHHGDNHFLFPAR